MAKGWTTEVMPDQRGRIAVVTGANSGIGFETARVLAQKGAQVILACRDPARAAAAAAAIAAAHPDASVEVMALDLGRLDSVRAFAAAFCERHPRLDILCNNAGIMIPPRGETAEGFESQLGVNHLGHFALVGRLLVPLLATPGARVVIVGSIAHRHGRIDFDDLQSERRYRPWRAYAQSKLANMLFCCELQRRFEAADSDVIAVAAHPGWTGTNLQQRSRFIMFANRLLAQSPARGALPTLYAATAPDVRGGDYYGPRGWFGLRGCPKRVEPKARARDEAVARRLWAVSEALTGVTFARPGASPGAHE